MPSVVEDGRYRSPLQGLKGGGALDIELHGVPFGRLEAVDWIESEIRSDRSSSWLADLLDESGQAGYDAPGHSCVQRGWVDDRACHCILTWVQWVMIQGCEKIRAAMDKPVPDILLRLRRAQA